MIDTVFSIFRQFFDFSQYMPTVFYPHSSAEPHRLESLWNWMVYAIKHTPDIMPNGDAYVRLHASLPSGCIHTQILDSWINALMILTCLSDCGFAISTDLMMKFLGDDSVIHLLISIPDTQHPALLDAFTASARRRFGAIVSPKSEILSMPFRTRYSPGIKVLGYRLTQTIPYRSDIDLLAALLHVYGNYQFEILKSRCVGIAYANLGQHQHVHDICRDIHDHLHARGIAYNPLSLREIGIVSQPYESEILPYAFPSLEKTQQGIFDISRTNTTTLVKLWPKSVFCSE